MNRNRRVSVIVKIFIVAFAVYAAVSFIKLQVKINEKKEEQIQLTEKRDKLKTKNAELSDIADSDADEDYIASIAREQLDYVYSGEQVFKDISGQ